MPDVDVFRVPKARPNTAFLQNLVVRTTRDNLFCERKQYVCGGLVLVCRNSGIDE
jgi:hypothetical protein